MEIVNLGDEIHLFGGRSPYTKSRPYIMRLDEKRAPMDAFRWLAHVSQKTWADEPGVYRLADILARYWSEK